MSTITSTEQVPQHMAALAKANEIRIARKELKERLDAREITVSDVLDVDKELPGYLAKVTLYDLLRWQHRVGHHRAKQTCQRLGISPSRRLRDLTLGQRTRICSITAGR